jgi:hypothetical protein
MKGLVEDSVPWRNFAKTYRVGGGSSVGLMPLDWYILDELSKDRKASGFRDKLSMKT